MGHYLSGELLMGKVVLVAEAKRSGSAAGNSRREVVKAVTPT